jgi:hypothetical protein
VCGEPPRPARDRGCAVDELLGFSVRLGAEGLTPEHAAKLADAPLQLSVFGLADDGSVRYYLPTPSDPSSPTLGLTSRWQPLPLSVRLAVNHRPGRVRVFALASPTRATVADIDRLAAALVGQARAEVDDPPWHLRLAPDRVAPLCSELDGCSSAETELEVTGSMPGAATDSFGRTP